ncbi:hypothetical protein K450DRAFT_242867 [Umbelopsis ramanniana AG]|uniref:Uncharacterized protein n=1 Tax=Umbelopsis ramanniana AG TaxID=1314678 RepID=A0AAD5E8I3_UMBRA|nr:uncharacterized protein K450DRAFT_242867 [Umbelopsis ramanniana AG]KAI8579358.1 hypothetical protein K450DRAFT_242867 [Umbelopsis ramanniana AG]
MRLDALHRRSFNRCFFKFEAAFILLRVVGNIALLLLLGLVGKYISCLRSKFAGSGALRFRFSVGTPKDTARH